MIKHGRAPYLECSSRGDRRFSAFYAKVNGLSIEVQYQAAKILKDGDTGVSAYEAQFYTKVINSLSTGLDVRTAKGRRAVNQANVIKLYSILWDLYIDANPELLDVLKKAKGLSDMFGQPGHCCQATELWRIRNER